MESLVITDLNNEYYINNQKLYFLENINRINLFIGANNTRKSRFLRKIIEAEVQLVVMSDNNINKEYIQGLQLASEIENQFKDSIKEELMAVTLTKHSPQKDKRFYEIDAYFNNYRANNDKVVYFKTIIDHLNNINKSILGVRVPGNIASFLNEVKMVYALVDMLVYLYELLAADRATLMSNINYGSTWKEENLNAYAFTFAEHLGSKHTTEKENYLKKVRHYLKFLLTVELVVGSTRLIYVPVLRSARALLQDNGSVVYEDVLKNAVHHQYFEGKLPNKGEQIYTAQLFYDGVKKQKNGPSHYRDDFKAFERFIGESFFQSGELEITAVHSDFGKKDITVDLPNERKDVPIQDLGDGVQAIINLLFPVFTARDDSWIFIDEPELNLHPGFQNLFIRTLIENEFLREKKLRYFINSHSNHILSEVLLSGSDNSEIFVFSKKDKDSSNINPFKGYEAATLELLGVLNTSTMISNCSVWVEGITDRFYVRAFLSAYMKDLMGFRPIEGLNYSFIEYGGSNLRHYLFDENADQSAINDGIKAYFVSNKIFLLSDKDFTKDKKHQFYETLNKKNFQYEHTRYPEIENLVPPQILCAFLIERLNVPQVKAKEIINKSYKKIKLGRFLTEQFSKHSINRKIAAKTGGALSPPYKLMLAEYVLNQIAAGKFGWEDIKVNDAISEIIPKLYQFIYIHNK
jgi:predicted ATPase